MIRRWDIERSPSVPFLFSSHLFRLHFNMHALYLSVLIRTCSWKQAYMHSDTHIAPYTVQRQTKVTLLQFGRRTVSESACSASHTALSALSIRLPVYLPSSSIWLWVYLVYLDPPACLPDCIWVHLSPYLLPSQFLLLKESVCFEWNVCHWTSSETPPPPPPPLSLKKFLRDFCTFPKSITLGHPRVLQQANYFMQQLARYTE